jgi:hypothetical protein
MNQRHLKHLQGTSENLEQLENSYSTFKIDMDFNKTHNMRNISSPMSFGGKKDTLSDNKLSATIQSFSNIKKGGNNTTDSTKSEKKKSRTKVINIKAKHKSEATKDKCVLQEFDAILNSQIDNYKHLNYDRITPGTIMKFSKGFQKIVDFSERYETGSDLSQKTGSAPLSPLHYVKCAYESFIKRIVGISDFSEIESVLKK